VTEAAAAVKAAREEPFEHALGDRSFQFLPELPVDLILAYDDLKVGSTAELEAWTVAHLLNDNLCDTSCVDGTLTRSRGRECPAEDFMRKQIRKARIGRKRLSAGDLSEFYGRVIDGYGMSEGESGSSAESSAAAGEPSNETAPEQGSTSEQSSDAEVGAVTASST
jgi:hypothetical protein